MSPAPVLSRFSYRAYLDMLLRFRDAEYEFAAFTDAERLLTQNRRFVLLRHDVDVDLVKAREMARREADVGASATYFFLVRTDHYNVFSGSGTRSVREIVALGHRLGLHFDCATYPGADVAALKAACAREVDMLEGWFHTPVTVVSYHRPSELVLSGDPELSAPLPHTYMPQFAKAIEYLSDSTGRWRYEYPPDSQALQIGLPIQLLTHPIWYAQTPRPPFQALLDILSEKVEALGESFANDSQVMREGLARSDDLGRTDRPLFSGRVMKDAA